MKGCFLNIKLCLRIGSSPDVIGSCEQGLHALEYTTSLSFAGLLHSRHLDETDASFSNTLMSVHVHEGRYEKTLEVSDKNKASLLLSLISEYDDAGSKLSDQDRTRLEDLKSKYRR